jgi:hypothetical protein
MPPVSSTIRRTTCRLCDGPILDPILHLGDYLLTGFPLPSEARAALPTAPLDFCQCRTCGLAQLRHTVDPKLLYTQYWYRSGINEAMRAELEDIVQAALREVSVTALDRVIDVGANDGYLLSCYPRQRAHWETERIAFEPAHNLQLECRRHCEVLVADYFPASKAHVLESLPVWEKRIKIITSIAMFYDLDDPHSFVEMVDRLLHPDGVWIVQFQDLGQMVDQAAFDNICHEHLTYFSMEAFTRLLPGRGLHVTHAERRPINGGSLRLHVRRLEFPEDRTVEHALLLERLSVDWQALERFAWTVGAANRQIRDVVEQAASKHLTIDLYGASTKANTLLQYCGLGPRRIRQAWERNAEKVGRVTATGIPIVSEQQGRGSPPDMLLVGIWQFRDHVLEREAAYLKAGGRVLFPLPEVDLVVGP